MEANLSTEGYQVLKAYNGQQAVEAVAEDVADSAGVGGRDG